MKEKDFLAAAKKAITDTSFERIELSLREPNIFSALSVKRLEIRHSNFLGYLLNPRESHGLGDIFLRKFLREVFSDDRSSNRSFFEADLLDLNAVEVRREWRKIDVLIVMPKDVIVIENKVDSKDGNGQLARYRRIAEKDFAGKNKHFVYLTIFGDDPLDIEESELWINYSYEQIARIIKTILELYRTSLSDKVRYYLCDYLTILQRDFFMNDELNMLAQKLYLSHKAAFDFIFENMPDTAEEVYKALEASLKESGYVIGSKSKRYLRFTSPLLAEKLPRTGSWQNGEAFLFEFDFGADRTKLVLKAAVSPGDEDVRKQILDAAEKLPKEMFKKPKGKQWMSFYIRKPSFKIDDKSEMQEAELKKETDALIGNLKDDVDTILRAIERVVGGAG